MTKRKQAGGKKIESKDIQGLKYFDKLAPLLERLHAVGTERDRAGNRQLHMDQYCMLVLLFLFNPVVTSLRAIQQASQLKKVQRKLQCPRASLGSLSEATDVFDPERLREVIDELNAQLKPIHADPRLQDVNQVLTVVDGTVVKTLTTIVRAAYLTSPRDGHRISAWRLHTHFEIDRSVPTRMDVTGGANQGDQDERYVLRQHLQPDVVTSWIAATRRSPCSMPLSRRRAAMSAAFATTVPMKSSKHDLSLRKPKRPRWWPTIELLSARVRRYAFAPIKPSAS